MSVTLYKCFENPFSIIFLSFELIQSVKTVLLSFEVMVILNTPSVVVGNTILFSLFGNIDFFSKAIEISCLNIEFVVSVLKKLVNSLFFWVNKKR